MNSEELKQLINEIFNGKQYTKADFDEICEYVDKMENALDKIYKENIWILEHYGEKLLAEFKINKGDDKSFVKVWKLFERIDKEMQERFPCHWYEIGFAEN